MLNSFNNLKQSLQILSGTLATEHDLFRPTDPLLHYCNCMPWYQVTSAWLVNPHKIYSVITTNTWGAAHLFLYQTSFRAFVIKQLVCWALMLVIIFFFHDSLGCPSSYHTSIGIAFHPYFLFIHKTCLSHLFSFPILSITLSSASIILPISLFDVSYSFDFLALLCPFLELIIYFFSIFYCPQLWTDSTSVFSIYF